MILPPTKGREIFMFRSIARIAIVSGVILLSFLFAGCGSKPAQAQSVVSAPQVTVAQAIARQVTDFDDFTGRFEAVDRVEIRPRVSGYISSINFSVRPLSI